MKQVVFLFFVSAVVVSAADDYEAVLRKDRLVIEAQLNRVNTAAKVALDAWPGLYQESLKRLEEQQKKAGNLDGVLAIRKESERFAQKKVISEDALVESHDELRELQIQAMKEPAKIDLRRNMQCVLVVDTYVSVLDELKKKLTKRGNVEQALLLHKESERVKTTTEYVVAKTALDAAGVEASVPRAAAATRSGSTSKAGNYSKKMLEGLVLYYTFDKDEGALVADASGHSQGGKLEGGERGVGKIGKAVHFAGESRIRLEKPLAFDKAMSLCVWFTIDSNFGLIAGKPGIQTYVLLINTPTDIYVGTTHGSGQVQWQLSRPLTPHVWQHGVMTWDGTDATFYLNGESLGRRRIPSISPIEYIGFGQASYHQGSLDEVMVFGRVLSDAEVKALYTGK